MVDMALLLGYSGNMAPMSSISGHAFIDSCKSAARSSPAYISLLDLSFYVDGAGGA